MSTIAYYPAPYGTVIYEDAKMGLSLATFYKTVYEQVQYTMDFGNVVPAADLLFESAVATDLATDLDVTLEIIVASPAPVVSGTGVTFQLQAGSVGGNYLIGIRVKNNDTGELFEGEITLVVSQ